MDLIAPDGTTGKGVLREARNVLISPLGTVRARPSFRSLSLTEYLTICVDKADNLHGITQTQWWVHRDEVTPPEVVAAISASARSTFATALTGEVVLVADDGIWQYADGRAERVTVEQASISAVREVSGGLTAGTYAVACSLVTDTGREGPLSYRAQIDVGAGGGVEVECAVPFGHSVRVYLSHPDGSELWRVGESASSPVAVLAAQYGAPALAEIEHSLPSGEYAALFGGRLFTGSGNTVFFSQLYRYGVMDAYAGYLPLPGAVTGMQAVDGALYIGTRSGAFLLSSTDMNTARLQQVSAEPVHPGSMALLDGQDMQGLMDNPPDGYVAAWFTGAGHMAGLTDGTVVTFSPQRLALGLEGSSSSTFFNDGGAYLATFCTAPAAYLPQCAVQKTGA